MVFLMSSKNHTDMQYPTLELFRTTEDFRYLWLKYIEGFDLSNHCAKCFVGKYSQYFRIGGAPVKHAVGLRLFESKARYYYLCGVTTPFRYEDNLHLAFRYEKGSQVVYNDGRTQIVIEDAVQIEIKALPDYSLHPCGYLSQYNTCRNWRFAYQVTYGL